MISLKLLNLLTVGGVALFVSSLAPSVNGLSNVGAVKHSHLNRLAAHEGLSKRVAKPKAKRALTKRCKTRDSGNGTSTDVASSTTWSSTWSAEATSTEASTTEWTSSAEPTSTEAPSTTWTPTSSSSEAAPSSTGSSSSSGSSKVGVAWSGSNDQEIATVKTSATRL